MKKLILGILICLTLTGAKVLAESDRGFNDFDRYKQERDQSDHRFDRERSTDYNSPRPKSPC